MSRVPFYANDESNMRCMVAVYRSIFAYFTRKRLSWSEADALVEHTPGKGSWTLLAITKLTRMGFDIHMVEPFDYRQFAKKGEEYLSERYNDVQLKWYKESSNLFSILPVIPEFLETVDWECRHATLDDIDQMLEEGRLVFISVNGRKLNGADGYSNHAILVTSKTDGGYIAHDPGNPPRPDRLINKETMWAAMGGDGNTAEVTGFKLAPGLGGRLDQFVIAKKPRLSRSYAAKLIADGRVLVNGNPSKPGYKVHFDDDILIDYDEDELDILPNTNIPILYEDNDCIVIDKPAGLLVHDKGGVLREPTVASWLRKRCALEMKGNRAGIVHRLDRTTSGVMLCAKNNRALNLLQKQFSDRTVDKTYVALVKGRLPYSQALIDMPIKRNAKHPHMFHVNPGGKPAKTDYKVLASGPTNSLVELHPQTGRTHQLRVQLAQIGHPIVGDTLYGGERAERIYLHAARLEITLPDQRREVFATKLPDAFIRKATEFGC